MSRRSKCGFITYIAKSIFLLFLSLITFLFPDYFPFPLAAPMNKHKQEGVPWPILGKPQLQCGAASGGARGSHAGEAQMLSFLL